jgi:hypothetical protein
MSTDGGTASPSTHRLASVEVKEVGDVSTAQPQSMLNVSQDVAGKVIVDGYRRLAAEHGCAPTAKTSDQEIVELYQKVSTAFRKAADQRAERLAAGTVNCIVWKFFKVSELLGNDMVDRHLSYEVQKYLDHGLRPDYQQALKLF